MKLDEKRTVLQFQRKPFRGKYLLKNSKFNLSVVIHLRTCPFDSQVDVFNREPISVLFYERLGLFGHIMS